MRIANVNPSRVYSKALLLGAGCVARPTLDILREAGISCTFHAAVIKSAHPQQEACRDDELRVARHDGARRGG